jgi:hypothetical protein
MGSGYCCKQFSNPSQRVAITTMNKFLLSTALMLAGAAYAAVPQAAEVHTFDAAQLPDEPPPPVIPPKVPHGIPTDPTPRRLRIHRRRRSRRSRRS